MRRADWQSRLAIVIKEHQRGVFAWGSNDCCLFTCNCIEALMGFDPAAELFRGKYSNMKEGYRLIKNVCAGGVERLAEVMAEQYGFIDIPPANAQRGDVGLYRDAMLGDTLGVCIGQQFAFVTEKDGMNYLKADALARAWRIG